MGFNKMLNMPEDFKIESSAYLIFCGYVVLLVLVVASLWWVEGVTLPDVFTEEESHLIEKSANEFQQPVVTESVILRQVSSDNVLEVLLGSRTLSGTVVNDQLRVSVNGELTISKSVIDLFDYFLMATGEITNDEIAQGIRTYLLDRLEEPALSTALELLNDYIGYIEALELGHDQTQHESDSHEVNYDQFYELLGNPEKLNAQLLLSLRSNLEYLSEMRRHYMGAAVANALWGEDELYDRYTLNRLDAAVNPEYDDVDRQAVIQLLESQLPEHLREERLIPLYHSQVGVDIAGDYGEAAAKRLQQLQHSREQFKLQYEYYDTHKQLITDSGLSEEDQKRAINQLRNEYFKTEQLSQVQALDMEQRITINDSGLRDTDQG